MPKARKIGNKGEELVAGYLAEQGYSIKERNYYSRYGEIDIVAKKDDTLAFVEVKSRKMGSMVSGGWNVGKSKQQKIIKTALVYISENNIQLQPRFDVALVINNKGESCIDYLENAFDGDIYW